MDKRFGLPGSVVDLRHKAAVGQAHSVSNTGLASSLSQHSLRMRNEKAL